MTITARGVMSLTLLSLSVAACSGLLESDGPAERTLWLNPCAAAHAGGEEAPIHGLAVEVAVVPGLDSDRLLTLSPKSELSHFNGARWPDHLPEMAAALLRRSLQLTGRYTRVNDGRKSGPQDCRLNLTINAFFTELDGTGTPRAVRAGASGHYDCGGTDGPVDIESTERVSGRQLTDVAAASQRVFDSLTRSLVSRLAVIEGETG